MPAHALKFILLLLPFLVCGLASADDEKSEEESEDKAQETAKLQRDLAEADLELQIAKLGLEMKQASTQKAIDDATRKLKEAGMALDVFVNREKPVKLDKSQIGLDRATYRAEHAEDELNELKAMYEAEEFAEMTKELVLKRGERQLETSKRDLDVEQRSFAIMSDYELPKKQRELEQSVREKELDLAQAQMSMTKELLQGQLSVMKAEHRLQGVKEKLAKAASEPQQ